MQNQLMKESNPNRKNLMDKINQIWRGRIGTKIKPYLITNSLANVHRNIIESKILKGR